MTKQTNTIETFILTLSESQKLYNIRNNKTKHNRKSKIYKQTQNANTTTQTQHKAQTKPQTQGTKRIKPPLFYDSRSTGDNSL